MIYLTVDQVKELHTQALGFGGMPGVRSEQLLASAVFQPQQSAFGEDAYPEIADKAAAYAFFLVENHPFLDANKRTAVAAMETFLDVNGHELVADDDEIELKFVALAAGEMGQGDFFAWVTGRVRRRGGEAQVINRSGE